MHYTLIKFARIPSTQDWLRRWAELGAREGLAVQAGAQSAGRGRLQRQWWSPPGDGLYLSVLLRPGIPLRRAAHLTMLAALAASDACVAVAGVHPRPKWPNDLLLRGRKLAGILTELGGEEDRLHYAVIGLGLNVNMIFSGGELADRAISLRQAAGRPIVVADLRAAYLAALGERYARFQAGESPLALWQANLEPLGRRVRVQVAGQPDLIGQAVGIHPDGALFVRDDGGHTHTIWAGDILPLASAD